MAVFMKYKPLMGGNRNKMRNETLLSDSLFHFYVHNIIKIVQNKMFSKPVSHQDDHYHNILFLLVSTFVHHLMSCTVPKTWKLFQESVSIQPFEKKECTLGYLKKSDIVHFVNLLMLISP